MKNYLKKILINIIFSLILYKNAYSNISHHHNKKINNYIAQLEHISNAHSQCLTQFQKQLLEIEQDIDYLRGKIQENEYKLTKINEEQNKIMKKVNILIERTLNKKNNFDDILFSPNDQHNPITPNKNDPHNIAYNKAVSLVLEKKQYEKAIQAFQEFVLQYPSSVYQANAHYWLGQLNYRKGYKHDASYHFALVAKKYPKSLKAPDSLLKVGLLMEECGNKDNAELIYKKVHNLYPNTDSDKQSQKQLVNLYKNRLIGNTKK